MEVKKTENAQLSQRLQQRSGVSAPLPQQQMLTAGFGSPHQVEQERQRQLTLRKKAHIEGLQQQLTSIDAALDGAGQQLTSIMEDAGQPQAPNIPTYMQRTPPGASASPSIRPQPQLTGDQLVDQFVADQLVVQFVDQFGVSGAVPPVLPTSRVSAISSSPAEYWDRLRDLMGDDHAAHAGGTGQPPIGTLLSPSGSYAPAPGSPRRT